MQLIRLLVNTTLAATVVITLLGIPQPSAADAKALPDWANTLTHERVMHCFPFLSDDIIGTVTGTYKRSPAPSVYVISQVSFARLWPADVEKVWNGSVKSDRASVVFSKIGPPKGSDDMVALGSTPSSPYVAFWDFADEYAAAGFVQVADESKFSGIRPVKLSSLFDREGSDQFRWIFDAVPASNRLNNCNMMAITVKSAAPVGPYEVNSIVFKRNGSDVELVAELASEAV